MPRRSEPKRLRFRIAAGASQNRNGVTDLRRLEAQALAEYLRLRRLREEAERTEKEVR